MEESTDSAMDGSVTERNQKHFDEQAASYDIRHSKTIQQAIVEIQKRLDFLGAAWADSDSSDSEGEDEAGRRKVRLLDYACGTGLVSRALAEYVTEIRAIDLSPAMVASYNASASNQGLEKFMAASAGNLVGVQPESGGATFEAQEWYDFDIVMVGLGWHHFEDPALAAKRLAARLKTGGVLCILDFETHAHDGGGHGGGHGHGHGHEKEATDAVTEESKAMATVTHHGFSADQIRKQFEDAGCGTGFAYEHVGGGFVVGASGGKRRSVFLARGVRS